MSSALLQMRGVTAFYGKAQALFGADLSVDAGQCVALLGRNGMGKTTAIRVICRMMNNRDGSVTFNGADISRLPSHQVARLGIGLVPEGRRCFAPLTVAENLTVAARPGPWDWPAVMQLFPRLEERQAQTARTLSGGEQQMLAIGRALMTNPQLLILDEATEGLAPVIRHEIWAALAALKRDGQSILLVDKNLAELLPIADHCVVFERGRTAWAGAAHDMTNDRAQRYLGV